MTSPSPTPTPFSQFLLSYAYSPTALSLPSTPVSKQKRPCPVPENTLPAPNVSRRKPRASKNTSLTISTSKRHVSPANVLQYNHTRGKSVTTSHQVPTVAGDTSVYFTPSRNQTSKGVSTSDRRRSGPRKLLDAVEILVKSTDSVLLSEQHASVEVPERLDRKRKLEHPSAVNLSHQRHAPLAKDECSIEFPEVEMKIPVTSGGYLTPISHEARSTLPTPSSQPRKRRKVSLSTQFTTLSSQSMTISLDKLATQPPCIDPTMLMSSKYFSEVAEPGKTWVPSSFPSENLFTYNYIPAFPSYYQDLFNDLIGYIANAKPILIQDAVSDNPWQFLIAVKLLNVTTGRYAIPVFWELMNRWPTPHDMVNANNTELMNALRPLGLYNKRAAWLKQMSQHYLDDPPTDILRSSNCRLEIHAKTRTKITAPAYTNPRKRSSPQSCSGPKKPRTTTMPYPPTPISHYPGIGRYALDSYRIFCTASEEWKEVMPEDKELIRYLRWKWAYEERKIWYPDGVGVVKDVDIPYLLVLVDELVEALEPDEFWGATDFISG
ncbi:hypothetical protein AZE42_06677 [Rhizopogon vesiculosus]|uniref:HhH-GPD domain-containing protein n=1 Tax=Rhizopogon vesiculosus TaxID=180088 RepID=A0A1J8R921_9AGAM|nr:hypothetical protein AZE42_06677 [Rhizopogon vesiculosus]